MINNNDLLPIGTELCSGKYRIDKHLASGGFGKTYIATDTSFDETVAIKELYIRGLCGRDAATGNVTVTLLDNKQSFMAQQEKFRKEARRLRKLDNQHIVKVRDLFDENGTSYYVMDFIDGESLSERIKRIGRLSEADIMALLPQILDALDVVHKEQIWHLDLKPANIMVDSGGCVKLIDFGASKQFRSSDGATMSTSSTMAYTPGFASSEQMEQNFEKFGPWTDLYSLGATIYYALTLNMPPSPSDINENPTEALKLPSNIGEKMAELITWLMKPNRIERPKNANEVSLALTDIGTNINNHDNVNSNDDTIIVNNDDGEIKTETKNQKPKNILWSCIENVFDWLLFAIDVFVIYGISFVVGRLCVLSYNEVADLLPTYLAKIDDVEAMTAWSILIIFFSFIAIKVYWYYKNGVVIISYIVAQLTVLSYNKVADLLPTYLTKIDEAGSPTAIVTLVIFVFAAIMNKRKDKHYQLIKAAKAFEKKQYEEAVKWYRKSAEQGDADAQYNLGCCYKNGQGVEQNIDKAKELFEKVLETEKEGEIYDEAMERLKEIESRQK